MTDCQSAADRYIARQAKKIPVELVFRSGQKTTLFLLADDWREMASGRPRSESRAVNAGWWGPER